MNLAQSFNEKPNYGLTSDLVVRAVENTAGFALSESDSEAFIQLINRAKINSVNGILEHFSLYLAAHFATVATFVPTDLDQTIRLKLWKQANSDELESMVQFCFEFLNWNESVVSTRWVKDESGGKISGHQGEWFSVIVGGYATAKKDRADLLPSLMDVVENLVVLHEKVLTNLFNEERFIDLATASALTAHNFGDLDRVMDMWEIPSTDILRERFYKLGLIPKARFKMIGLAGAVNKRFTAAESHRHFSLRKPRSLRCSRDFLIGMGPCYDEWGRRLGKSPQLRSEDLIEISEALVDGWEKLNRVQPVYGYARALAGLSETKLGYEALNHLTSSRKKILRAGSLNQMMSVPKNKFEESLKQSIFKFIKNAN